MESIIEEDEDDSGNNRRISFPGRAITNGFDQWESRLAATPGANAIHQVWDKEPNLENNSQKIIANNTNTSYKSLI